MRHINRHPTHLTAHFNRDVPNAARATSLNGMLPLTPEPVPFVLECRRVPAGRAWTERGRNHGTELIVVAAAPLVIGAISLIGGIFGSRPGAVLGIFGLGIGVALLAYGIRVLGYTRTLTITGAEAVIEAKTRAPATSFRAPLRECRLLVHPLDDSRSRGPSWRGYIAVVHVPGAAPFVLAAAKLRGPIDQYAAEFSRLGLSPTSGETLKAAVSRWLSRRRTRRIERSLCPRCGTPVPDGWLAGCESCRWGMS
jgi:hypothetical protein